MFEITKLEVNRNPFIGLYFTASDNALLYAPSIPEKTMRLAEQILKPKKISRSNIAHFHLVGLFSVMNSNGILLPDFCEEAERKKIETDLELRSTLIDDRFSALRNNIIANDNGALVNGDMTHEEIRKIQDCLDVEVVKMHMGPVKTIGAMSVSTNNGALLFNGVAGSEAELVEKVLKVKVTRGTTNLGAIANSYGVVANRHGALVGSLSSGFEVAGVYEALSGGE